VTPDERNDLLLVPADLYTDRDVLDRIEDALMAEDLHCVELEHDSGVAVDLAPYVQVHVKVVAEGFSLRLVVCGRPHRSIGTVTHDRDVVLLCAALRAKAMRVKRLFDL